MKIGVCTIPKGGAYFTLAVKNISEGDRPKYLRTAGEGEGPTDSTGNEGGLARLDRRQNTPASNQPNVFV